MKPQDNDSIVSINILCFYMDYIDYKGIANLVRKREVNFISFVMTPWHLIGAKAAIQHMLQERIEVNPLIISIPHPDTGFSVTQDDEFTIYKIKDNYPRTNIIRYISFLLWCWRTANQSDVKLYFANPWYGNFKSLFWILSSCRTIFKIIIFEEGIGTYVKDYYTLKNPMLKRNILQMIQLGVDLNLSNYYNKTGRLINLNPLKYNVEGKLVYNEKAIVAYKKALNIVPISLNEKKAIILTQELDGEIYNVVNRVSNYLNNCGVDVYIKAHPRFPIDPNLLECRAELVEHAVAIESVLQTIGTKNVISFNTTSLVSLRYLYDVTTISLLHLVREDCCQGLFNCHSHFNAWFENSFSGMIQFPKNMEELQGIIGSPQ